jgi:cytochrome P450
MARSSADPSPAAFQSLAARLASLAGELPAEQAVALTALLESADQRLRAEADGDGLSAPDVAADPYPVYRDLRAGGAVRWSESRNAWLVTAHAELLAIEHDPRISFAARYVAAIDGLSEAERAAMPAFLRTTARHLGHTDPPAHTRQRRAFDAALTPRAVHALRPAIKQIVDDLLESFGDAGRIDAVADLAERLPLPVLGALLGIPGEDFDRVAGPAAAYLGPIGSGDGDTTVARRKEAAATALVDYMRGALRERQRAPCADLLSALAEQMQPVGGHDEDEIVVISIQILTGGFESLRHMIALGLLALLRHPRELARLRTEPGLIPVAVEELLRYDGVVQQLTRVATDDIEVGGAQIRPGDTILLLPAAANRDPEAFAEPDRLDCRRRGARHLAFGSGAHACPGAGLARAVAQITFAALIERFAVLELDAEAPMWEPDFRAHALTSLPIVYSRFPVAGA